MQNEPTVTKVGPGDGATSEEITTLNLNNATSGTISIDDKAAMAGVVEGYRLKSDSGARWFYWIAALSLVNTIVVVADGNWSFLAGLGITQLISGLAYGLAQDLGGTVTVVAVALNLIVTTIFIGFGYFAQKHNTWAFVLGMTVYGLDGLIFLYFQDWLALAFHLYVLYALYRGLSANREYTRLHAEGLAT